MLERGRMVGKFKTVSALLSAYESLEAEFTKRCQQLSGLRNELETLKRETHLRANEEEAACEKVFDVTNAQGKEKIEATELEESANDSAQKNDSVKEEGADIESVNCEGAKAEVSADIESCVNCERAKPLSCANGEELKAEVSAESDIAVTAQRAAEQAERAAMQTARQAAEQAAMQAEQAAMQAAEQAEQAAIQTARQTAEQTAQQSEMQTARQTAEQTAQQAEMQSAEQAAMQAEQAVMQTVRQTAEQAAMQTAQQAEMQTAMQTEQGADEFLQRALADERVRQAIIAEYFNEIAARKNIVMSQGAVPITPPTRPKTLKEAKALADKLLF